MTLFHRRLRLAALVILLPTFGCGAPTRTNGNADGSGRDATTDVVESRDGSGGDGGGSDGATDLARDLTDGPDAPADAADAGVDRAADLIDAAGSDADAVSTDPAILAIESFIAAHMPDKTNPSWRTSLAKPSVVTFTAGKSYIWTLETNLGTMTLKFLPAVAPMHVTSTIYLTLLGFYDTLTFHRIIPAFMAQGGDPLGNGTGNPGYAYSTESMTGTDFIPFRLAMANAGPGTDGSQFFITFADFTSGSLDPTSYSIFGDLVSGMTTLAAIEGVGTGGGTPTSAVTITKATVSVE